jgi:hypothetical protein
MRVTGEKGVSLGVVPETSGVVGGRAKRASWGGDKVKTQTEDASNRVREIITGEVVER